MVRSKTTRQQVKNKFLVYIPSSEKLVNIGMNFIFVDFIDV